jgi:outer membrane protein OmpA-like peptidoglycan-associated protein
MLTDAVACLNVRLCVRKRDVCSHAVFHAPRSVANIFEYGNFRAQTAGMMTSIRPLYVVFAVLSLTWLTAHAAASSGHADFAHGEDETAEFKKIDQPAATVPNIEIPRVNIPSLERPVVNLPATAPPVIELFDVPIPGVEFRESDSIALIRLSGDILFDFDKSAIRPEAVLTLSQVKNVLVSRYSGAPITIHGHTDSKGSEAYNLVLSEARATSVREWLILNGLPAQNLTIMAHGERHPIASNENADGSDNPVGRQLNRRVEIAVKLQ